MSIFLLPIWLALSIKQKDLLQPKKICNIANLKRGTTEKENNNVKRKPNGDAFKKAHQ